MITLIVLVTVLAVIGVMLCAAPVILIGILCRW